MTKNSWFKHDIHWREDPKFVLFEDKFGKTNLGDVWTVFSLIASADGAFCVSDEGMMALMRMQTRIRSAKQLESFLERMAECKLIRPDSFEQGIITNDRARVDADARLRRTKIAHDASQAADEKRRGKL